MSNLNTMKEDKTKNLYEEYYGPQWKHWVDRRNRNICKAEIMIFTTLIAIVVIGVKLLFF